MCTNFLLSVPSNPGNLPASTLHVSARCLELTGHMPTSLYRIPRDQSFPLTKNSPRWLHNPARWSNRYGFIGIANPQVFKEMPCFMDGLNERGLSFGALWLPGTSYPQTSPQVQNQVAFYDLGAWILGQFETVDEVRAALENIRLVGPPTPTTNAQDLLSHYLPLHFIVTDALGKSLVLECVDGEVAVYPRARHEGETDDGVLTNAPTYDWQRTNLTNYQHLVVTGPATSVVHSTGIVGNGLLGLPGDSMSASRFVKAATLRKGYGLLPASGQGWLPAPAGGESGYASSEQTVVNAAMQLVQIVQTTPYATALVVDDKTQQLKVGDWTMWSVVRDHTHRKLYFTTAFNGIMRVVALDAIDFDAQIVDDDYVTLAMLPEPESFAWCEDVTGRLKVGETELA